MKILTIVIFSIILLCSNDLFANGFYNDSIVAPIKFKPDVGMFDDLIGIYNELIALTKLSIQDNMKKIVNSARLLLGTMATLWIIVVGAKSMIAGSYFFNDLMLKMFVFLLLWALLNFNWYDQYIVKNLELLFTNLPTLFSSSGGDVISNIINQTSMLSGEIWKGVEELGWRAIFGVVIALIAMISLVLLSVVIVMNVLIISVEFYFVLSLSSLLILLYFFKFTRNFSIQALNVSLGAIGKLTMLSMFLSIFGGVISNALKFDNQDDFFSACIGVILICSVGMVLIKLVNDISNRIMGGVGQLAGQNTPAMDNAAKRIGGKISEQMAKLKPKNQSGG